MMNIGSVLLLENHVPWQKSRAGHQSDMENGLWVQANKQQLLMSSRQQMARQPDGCMTQIYLLTCAPAPLTAQAVQAL